MNSLTGSLMGKLFSKRKKSAGPSRPATSEISSLRRHSSPHCQDGEPNDATTQLQHCDAVVSVASVQPGLCLSGSKDKQIILYDFVYKRQAERWSGHDGAVTKVIYGHACKDVFSSSRDKTIRMWRRGHTSCIQEFSGHGLVVTAIHLNEDNTRLCSGSRDNTVRLWDVETASCLMSNNIPQNLVTDVKFVPGSPFIVQAGEDKEIRVFDQRNLQPVFSFPKKQYIQMCCDISADGHYIVSSSNGFSGNGCEATLWDLRSRKLHVEYQGHVEAVEACMFLPDSERPCVVTASRDCSVRVWDMMTGSCDCECFISGSGPLTSLAAYKNGSILVGSFNQGVQVLKLSGNQLVKYSHY